MEIEDFEFDEEEGVYYYPCPCGDKFAISLEELEAGEEIATCPSCSLIVKVCTKIETDDFICVLAQKSKKSLTKFLDLLQYP